MPASLLILAKGNQSTIALLTSASVCAGLALFNFLHRGVLHILLVTHDGRRDKGPLVPFSPGQHQKSPPL